ncbi:MAG: penicillin-binding protein 2 [Candidatus Gracilibacteria bacterium]|nr:penicillin-binding protein 2 [Candidatus Gracilibacteria bacterium]
MNKFRLQHKIRQAFNKNDNILEKFFKLFDVFPRIYYVIGFFCIFAFAIVFKTFSYTVLNHSKYVQMAENQQISENVIDVNRGSIYSDNERGKILATSVDLNDLAVDPSVAGSKGKLASVLTDLVYNETCKNKRRKQCYDNMLVFLKVPKIENFNTSQSKVKSIIKSKINDQISRDKVTSVLLRTELNDDEKFELDKISLRGLYLFQDNLYANPEEIEDANFVANKIEKFFIDDDIIDEKTGEVKQLSQEELGKLKKEKIDNIKKALRKRDLKYVKIFSKLSIGASDYLQEKIKKEKDAIIKGIINKEEAFSNFIILEPHQTRFYPEKNLAGQVLGFLDNGRVGRYGIEAYYNDILNGQKGKINYKRATSGVIINPADIEETAVGIDGASVVLTIDRNIQNEVERLLEEGVKEFRANKGTAIVMNPKTGELIAMADYPTYDPNNFGDVYEIEKVDFNKYQNPEVDLLGIPILIQDKIEGEKYFYKGKTLLLREATDDERLNSAVVKYKYKNDFGPAVYKNDAISELYEPGSIFKPIIVAMGLDSGDLHRFDTYRDKGYAMIDQFKITNVSSKCKGPSQTFQHALNYSCNTGMIEMIQRVGKSLIHDYLLDFGFGNISGITLDGEVFSRVEPFETWSRAKLFTTSFGRGMVTTPIKVATAYATMANSGIRMKPTIVKEIRFANGKVVKNNIIPEKRVISEETSKTITEMLVDGVENGVASNGKVEGYLVAGKTGTAGYVKKGKYEEGPATTIGSFAGYAPADDPKFVILVKLDRPRTSEFGGATSAHIFNRIATFLFEYYKIPKNVKHTEKIEDK